MSSPPDISRSERIGLHPLAAIFALMPLGQIFGFFGILTHCRLRRCCWSDCTNSAGCAWPTALVEVEG